MKFSIRLLCGNIFNTRDAAPNTQPSTGWTSHAAHSTVSRAPAGALQALRDLQEIGPARAVSPVEPELRTLAPAFYKASHQHHGEFSLEQLGKASDSRVVEFKLQLKTRKGGVVSARQEMYVDNSDPEYGGCSTFGYGDIYLPEEMQQKGIGYLLHYAGADAAIKLKVRRLVVSNVVSEPMHAVCDKMGMADDGVVANSYSGDPRQVAQNCATKAQAKGWLVEHS
ncbi:hypothetical protein [Burkholderia cepacia]|uniref:hypothetical protein n=1 Tax=Burkholderia cepacia TaxID=292 RepID=UPI00158C6F40|nr:hypothetical protein [Burkholderia cepacia]